MTPRRIDAEDIEAHDVIHTLLHRAFAFMEGRIDPPSSLHQLTCDGITVHARDGEIWVIGDPVEACVFLTPRPGRLYLGKLAVTHHARGLGHAKRLVALAETRANALGLTILELETRIELVENHAAFTAMGFAKTNETAHAGYDHPTGIVMQKAV